MTLISFLHKKCSFAQFNQVIEYNGIWRQSDSQSGHHRSRDWPDLEYAEHSNRQYFRTSKSLQELIVITKIVIYNMSSAHIEIGSKMKKMSMPVNQGSPKLNH